MKPARRPTPTAVSMRRWLCAWLALLTTLQLAASVLAGLQGSLHRHRPALQAAATSTLVVRWNHAKRADAEHRAMHERGELHPHDLHDPSVVPIAGDLASDALAQLAGASALAQQDANGCLLAAARHELPQAASWAATRRTLAPPLRPPRA